MTRPEKNNIDETQTISLERSEPDDLMQDPSQDQAFRANLRQMDLKETETEKNPLRRLATGLCTV